MKSTGTELSLSSKSLALQNLRHILPVYEDLGEEAIADIPTARDDAHRAATRNASNRCFAACPFGAQNSDILNSCGLLLNSRDKKTRTSP